MSDVITRFDLGTAATFMREAERALQFVAQRHGLKVETTLDRSDLFSVGGNVKFVVAQDADGNDFDPGRDKWNKHARYLGLEEGWYGQTFWDRGEKLKVTDVLPNRPKNCVQLTRVSDGKVFICKPAYLRSRL